MTNFEIDSLVVRNEHISGRLVICNFALERAAKLLRGFGDEMSALWLEQVKKANGS